MFHSGRGRVVNATSGCKEDDYNVKSNAERCGDVCTFELVNPDCASLVSGLMAGVQAAQKAVSALPSVG